MDERQVHPNVFVVEKPTLRVIIRKGGMQYTVAVPDGEVQRASLNGVVGYVKPAGERRACR